MSFIPLIGEILVSKMRYTVVPNSPVGRVYKEPMRPQVHFSPRRGWKNDPSGLAFSKGRYHLILSSTLLGGVRGECKGKS